MSLFFTTKLLYKFFLFRYYKISLRYNFLFNILFLKSESSEDEIVNNYNEDKIVNNYNDEELGLLYYHLMNSTIST